MKTSHDNHDYLKKKGLINSLVLKVTFIAIGVSSTVWFLVRVIPKPQRAAYPCMRAAAPLMSSFVLYLISLVGSVAAFRQARNFFRQSKFMYASLLLVVALISFALLLTQKTETVYAQQDNATMIKGANDPIGIARGIFPGRVVWTHDPKVAQWDEKTGFWWDDAYTSQTETNNMLNTTLLSLTEQKTEAKAWDALFTNFNKTKKKGKYGYQANQKIAIKINENNTDSHANVNELNASPQVTYAVLQSLIKEAGIPQKNITVFDASRFITDNVFNKCHSAFPEVVFVDNVGGDGRVKATYKEEAIPYSADNGKLARGLATCALGADYLINVALLKGHVGQGVTLCAKNYYGVTDIHSNWRLNAHNNFDQDRQGKPKYMTFVDFLGHKDLGEKTMLFLIDGLYGSKSVNGLPKPKWKTAPFNDSWACSLLASEDGVAIDAVGLDLLSNEWPDLPDLKYADQYLVEAALADNPPSGTFYDPEHDKIRCQSLGVMEHWNNPTDKKYSRNLGKKEGIELIQKTID